MTKYIIESIEKMFNVSRVGSANILVTEVNPDEVIPIFYDSADGTVIDVAKWEVTNNDPDIFKIYQSNSLIIEKIRAGGVLSYFDNCIKTVDSFTTGVIKFSMVSMNNKVSTGSSYMRMSLLNDSENQIAFEHRPLFDGKISCTIKQAGKSDIELGGINKWFINVKIIITETHITVYHWHNDSWLQLSDTQAANIGAFKIVSSTRGYALGYQSIKDIYVTEEDFNTINP